MESSNARNERRIRKFSVHLTRLTDEDIDSIRRRMKQEAPEKAKKESKTKKKKSSNGRSVEAATSTANYISESIDNDLLLQNSLHKPLKTKNKKKSASSSSKRPKRKKCPPKRSSSRPSSKKIIIDDRTSTWNDRRYYSTSDESELDEVFVPRKIWVKPSARPMSPTSSDSDTTEIQLLPEPYITSVFSIRKAVVLLKKMIPYEDTKHEICDDTVPSINDSRARNSSNTNCCLQLQEACQKCSSQAVTSGSHEGESESKESTDGKLFQHPQTADQLFEGDHKPTISSCKETAVSKITGNSPPQCSCQLAAASPKTITPVVRTDEPETSDQSNLTNELAEAYAQNSDSLRDANLAERNESDDAIFSPVIFDEKSQATQEFGGQAPSPVIFGSNEGTAAESADTSNGPSNQYQDAIPDTPNSSSSFSLELTDEQSEEEAPSKNCNLVPDPSQNYNLQLSENIPHQNVQSRVNSQNSSSCSFALEISGDCTIEDVSVSKNSELFSSHEDTVSSKNNQSNFSDEATSCSLSAFKVPSIPESENNDQSIKDSQKVCSSTLTDKSHAVSSKIGSTAGRTANFSENQNIFSYSLNRLKPKRPKVSFLKMAPNISCGENTNPPMAEDSNLARSQNSPLFAVTASHLLKGKKRNYSSGLDGSSMSKKSHSSIVECPSFSKSEKSFSSGSEATNTSRKSYSLSSEGQNPLDTQKSNLPPVKVSKLSASVPINCNDAFTQTDLQQRVHQQPSQLSVNYIINSSSLDTIRFEGPVVNQPATMTAIGEKIATSDSAFVADSLLCPTVFSTNRTKRIPCECNVQNFMHCSGVPPAKLHCEDSQLLESKIVMDVIDLTGEDESKFGEQPLGKIRLKTPSELGCTIAFTDDVERLFRLELPKLQCNFDKLELLKKKHFNIFKFVLAKYYRGKPVNDTLQELYSTRSVPCGSNLLRHSPPVGLGLMQMSVKCLAPPNLRHLPGRNLFHGNTSGISNRGHHGNATVLGKPIC